MSWQEAKSERERGREEESKGGRQREREGEENTAGERRNAGSFAWLESKEAVKRFFPLLFQERGSMANHTHCWKTTLRRKNRGKKENNGWKRGEDTLKKKREQEWRGWRR